MTIGNVSAFRDWSHVDDIVEGYLILAQRGTLGGILSGGKQVEVPRQMSPREHFGKRFDVTMIDELLLRDKLEFVPEDEGLVARTDSGDVEVRFDRQRFRLAEVPILLSDIARARTLGFAPHKSLKEIIEDQVSYFLRGENR